MNFKILSVAIMVAATLTALASTPLTTTPAYAAGNVHNNNIGNHAGGDVFNDIDQTGDCNTVKGDNTCGNTGGGSSNPPTCNPQGLPAGCVPRT